MRLTAVYESCTQRPAEEHTSSHTGPPRGCPWGHLGDKVNWQGQWETGFVVTRGWGGRPLVPEGGCGRLVGMIPWAGREGRAAVLRTGWGAAGPASKGDSLGREPSCRVGACLGRAGALVVRSLGLCGAQRCQGSCTWNF